MQSAYHFFLKHAGYSYHPTRESRSEGRIRCAKRLAEAERFAQFNAITYAWQVDPSIDSSDFTDEKPAWALWECVAFDRENRAVASLCGIDFGRERDPWMDPYRRVVEAQLALEALQND